MSERFEFLDHDETYYIVDNKSVKSEEEFIQEYLEKYEEELEEKEYTTEEVKEMALEAYYEYLYIESMDGRVLTDILNTQDTILKSQKHVMDLLQTTVDFQRSYINKLEHEQRCLLEEMENHIGSC